jgi:hypothetical protein
MTADKMEKINAPRPQSGAAFESAEKGSEADPAGE